MDLVYQHNLFNSWEGTISHLLRVTNHCFGSDPLTHKRIQEEQTTNVPSQGAPSEQTASSLTPSTNAQTNPTDSCSQTPGRGQ